MHKITDANVMMYISSSRWQLQVSTIQNSGLYFFVFYQIISNSEIHFNLLFCFSIKPEPCGASCSSGPMLSFCRYYQSNTMCVKMFLFLHPKSHSHLSVKTFLLTSHCSFFYSKPGTRIVPPTDTHSRFFTDCPPVTENTKRPHTPSSTACFKVIQSSVWHKTCRSDLQSVFFFTDNH